MKNEINVAIRVKDSLNSPACIVDSNGSIEINTLKVPKKFTFSSIFQNWDETDVVYDTFLDSIVEKILSGINGTIFGYGSKKSGKTRSLFGEPDHPGIISCVFDQIFENAMNSEMKYSVHGSLIEILNENVIDLLSKSNSFSNQIPDFEEIPLRRKSCIDEMLSKISLSKPNSHIIFKMHFESLNPSNPNEPAIISTISFVELSDPNENSISFQALSSVLKSFKQANNTIFSDSILTRILANEINRSSIITFLIHFTNDEHEKDEINKILTFASSVQNFFTFPKVNKISQLESRITIDPTCVVGYNENNKDPSKLNVVDWNSDDDIIGSDDDTDLNLNGSKYISESSVMSSDSNKSNDEKTTYSIGKLPLRSNFNPTFNKKSADDSDLEINNEVDKFIKANNSPNLLENNSFSQDGPEKVIYKKSQIPISKKEINKKDVQNSSTNRFDGISNKFNSFQWQTQKNYNDGTTHISQEQNNDPQIKSANQNSITKYDVDERTKYDVDNRTKYDVDNRTKYDVDNRTKYDVDNRTKYDDDYPHTTEFSSPDASLSQTSELLSNRKMLSSGKKNDDKNKNIGNYQKNEKLSTPTYSGHYIEDDSLQNGPINQKSLIPTPEYIQSQNQITSFENSKPAYNFAQSKIPVKDSSFKLKQDNNLLKATNENLQKEINDLKKEIDNLLEEKKAFQEQIIKCSNEKEALNKELMNEKNENSRMVFELTNNHNTIKQQQKKIDELVRLNDKKPPAKVGTLSKSIQTDETKESMELIQANIKIQEMEFDNEKLQREISKLQHQKELLSFHPCLELSLASSYETKEIQVKNIDTSAILSPTPELSSISEIKTEIQQKNMISSKQSNTTSMIILTLLLVLTMIIYYLMLNY